MNYTGKLHNLDVLSVGVVVALWVILISDNPLSFPSGILFGTTAGIVYYFMKLRKDWIVKPQKMPKVSYSIVLLVFFIAFIFALSASRESLIFANWFDIQTPDYIWFSVVYAFLAFVPGFLFVTLVDYKNQLSTLPMVVLSVLISIFFTSQILYITDKIALDSQLTNFMFIAVNGVLLVIYFLKLIRVRESVPKENEYINVNLLIALALLVVLSAILVYIQQFVYQPFIRGDNWNYLATSNYIDKGSSSLVSLGKFYSIKTMSVFELYNLALFHLSGFPAVNAMMINSLVIAALVPLAFYIMVSSFIKSKKVSLLSTFVYVAFSGFGWIPFVSGKFSQGLQQYLPQGLSAIFIDLNSKVLNDISQPQGSIPEGFKTYILALLSIIMIVYLLRSNLTSKTRLPLIGIIVAFAFLAHIETTLAFFATFLPVYVLLGKRLVEVRKNLLALALGVFATVVIGLSSPTFLIIPFEFNYALVFVILAVLFALSYVRTPLLTKVGNFRNHLLSHKTILLLLICYLYLLSIIVLVSYGYAHMNYGDAVVYQGYTFPWYYYPLSLGVVGTLVLVGLSMDFQKYRSLFFFALVALFTVVLGFVISYFNLNFFNTGTKEWRLIYRILPLATSPFAGWALFKLGSFFRNVKAVNENTFVSKSRRFRKRWLFCLAFVLVVVVGISSTILAAEYWMSTNSTSFGPADGTRSNVELANFVKQNIPITSRVATLGDTAHAVIKLAGGTTAVPGIYPDFLSSNRPETIAFLSSDIGFVCIDKTIDMQSINEQFVKYLPMVFSNSRFEVYRVPFLESSSESNLGYLAPVSYNKDSLASYLIVALLNSSYEIVDDNFYNKSIIILPTDFQEEGSNSSHSAELLNWTQNGGQLIVMGDQGEIFASLGLTVSDVKSEVNGVTTESGTLDLNSTSVNSVKTNSDVDVLGFYTSNGQNVSPFIIEKHIGNGAIFYVNVNPIYKNIQNNRIDWKSLSDIISAVKGSLDQAGVKFSEPSDNLSKEPLENRWIGRYLTYGTQDFWAEGYITANAVVSGSNFLGGQTIMAEKIVAVFNKRQIVTENTTVESVFVYGTANITIQSDFLNVSADQESLPSFIPIMQNESTIRITPSYGSRIGIQLSNGNYSLIDGSISIETNSSELFLRLPQFAVEGVIHFAQVSLPTTTSAWVNNVQLAGNLNFGINYNDGNYFFTKQLTGNYNQVTDQNSALDTVPLTSMLLSLPNIFLTVGIIVIAILTFRKPGKHDIPR